MKAISDIQHGLENAWGSLAQGWRHLSSKAERALTRFKPLKKTAEEGDPLPVEMPDWGLLAGEVFEDENKIVVRIEAPGLERDDFDLEVRGDLLVVRGEKRFRRESREGGYHLMECAYGSFHRAVPLPAPVRPDRAKARYRHGVLRIELPKAEGAGSRRIDEAQSGQRRCLLPLPTILTHWAYQSISPILSCTASLTRAPEL